MTEHQGNTEKLSNLEVLIRSQARCSERIAQYLGESEVRRLLSELKHPDRLEHCGRKVYSQSDEDGILGEILRRIGLRPEDGLFIEFGVENGLQSNTHWLLRQGYSGVWLECDDGAVKWLRRFFADYLADGRLQLAEERVERDTIDRRLAALAASTPVTVLSIDVDGNDYWLWEQIEAIRPAVVVIEYNATFPPPTSVVQEYDASGPRKIRNDYFGASLSALHKLGRRKGYQLVGCNIVGVNAFFVRDDCFSVSRFPYPCTPDELYHPLRKKLVADAFVPGYAPAVGRYVQI
jgi:hypothetical protein